MNEPEDRGTQPLRKIKSMDDILRDLSEIADQGEGSDRTQAYRLLMSQAPSQAALPSLLPEDEVLKKLTMLIKAAGPSLARLAYHRAWPNRRKGIDEEVVLEFGDVQVPENFHFPLSLRQFYRMFPDLKRNGFPPGYPQRRGKAIQAEWLRVETLKVLRDQQQAEQIKSESTDAQTTPGTAQDD